MANQSGYVEYFYHHVQNHYLTFSAFTFSRMICTRFVSSKDQGVFILQKPYVQVLNLLIYTILN